MVQLHWGHGGSHVCIAGSFTDWKVHDTVYRQRHATPTRLTPLHARCTAARNGNGMCALSHAVDTHDGCSASERRHSFVTLLPSGSYQYKFIVDGQVSSMSSVGAVGRPIPLFSIAHDIAFFVVN